MNFNDYIRVGSAILDPPSSTNDFKHGTEKKTSCDYEKEKKLGQPKSNGIFIWRPRGFILA